MIGDDIYIKFTISKIKRNPICTDPKTFTGIMNYLEKVREVGKELMNEGEYINAQDLYKRILPQFKNMPKTMRDALSKDEHQQRNDALHLLLLNISFCHLKRNQPIEAVKTAHEAMEYNKENPKGYYRLAMAQKANGEFDQAKENMIKAINMSPADQSLRTEYKNLLDHMNAKKKEWYSKMSGFLHSEKMRKIE